MQHGDGGKAGSGGDNLATSADNWRARYDAGLCWYSSRQRLAGCQDGAYSAICRAAREFAVACPQDPDLRRSRTRGDTRRKQSDTHRQCARLVPAAFPGADRLEPVLERARHRARLEPVRDLRRTTYFGAATTISGLE